MSDRPLSFEPRVCDVVLRSAPNWTAVGFLAALSLVHLSIAIPSLLEGRWAGHLSLGLGAVFALASVGCWRARHEIAILSAERRVRLRSGWGRLRVERSIPFCAVQAVRLTLGGRRHNESRIELLCDDEDLECPPTDIPREQALCLAMAMNVRLIRISDDAAPIRL